MVERGYEEYWLLRDMGPRSVTYGDPRCVLATEDPCDRKGGFSRTPRNRKLPPHENRHGKISEEHDRYR